MASFYWGNREGGGGDSPPPPPPPLYETLHIHVHTHTHTHSHCAEVLVNTPGQCACMYLIPPQIQVMPTLCSLYPNHYQLPSAGHAKKGDDQPSLYTQDLDCVSEGWNMAAVMALINYLDIQLVLCLQLYLGLDCSESKITTSAVYLL